jgi:Spy/CpxP family protein refolding chaperone
VTLDLTSRRHLAGRSRLLAIAPLGLGLLLPGSPAAAQHGGGAPGERSMTQRPGGMSGGSGSMLYEDRGGMRSGRFDQPGPQPRMGLQLGLGGRWWDDHKIGRKLSLSPDQQHRMDNIFEANKPTLIALYGNLQREEVNLASISRTDLQDESKVLAAIDRVAHARNDLEKENVHILLQIRQQLAPQQLEALDHAIASAH